MKECDILWGCKTYSDPSYIFSWGQVPSPADDLRPCSDVTGASPEFIQRRLPYDTCRTGREKKPKFIAGIMIARKGSTFMRLFYESYRNNYRAWDWDYNCARVPYRLYLQRPDLLHVEPYKFTTPDWTERDKLWEQVIDWKDLYVIHVMGHLFRDRSSPTSISQLNSTFGQVMRYIYYGSPKLR